MKRHNVATVFLGVLFLAIVGAKGIYCQPVYIANILTNSKGTYILPAGVDTNTLSNAEKQILAGWEFEEEYCNDSVQDDGWCDITLFDLDSAGLVQALLMDFDTVYAHDSFIIGTWYDENTEIAFNLDSLIYEQRGYGEKDNGDKVYCILRVNYIRTTENYIIPVKMTFVQYDTLPSGTSYEGKLVSIYLYYGILDKDGATLSSWGDENLFNDCMKKTGIKEIQQNANITIYPNPTTGQLTIKNEKLTIKNIEIFDIVGKRVMSSESPMSPETTINISHLSNGMYFLKVDNKTFKIIKN